MEYYWYCIHLISLWDHNVFINDGKKLMNMTLGLASNGIMFIPSFVNIGQLVQKLRGGRQSER
jgi:hypothetical protein